MFWGGGNAKEATRESGVPGMGKNGAVWLLQMV